MKDQIVPAQPGFLFLTADMDGDGKPRLWFTPIVAWRIPADGHQVLPVVPSWTPITEDMPVYGIRYPDGQTWTGDWMPYPAGADDADIATALLPEPAKKLSLVKSETV